MSGILNKIQETLCCHYPKHHIDVNDKEGVISAEKINEKIGYKKKKEKSKPKKKKNKVKKGKDEEEEEEEEEEKHEEGGCGDGIHCGGCFCCRFFIV